MAPCWSRAGPLLKASHTQPLLSVLFGWREPAPVKRWTGLRDATSFGPACAQRPILIPSTMPTSEDCLYLNIWTAEWPSTSRKPVMVWIPGGGNFGGSATREVSVSDSWRGAASCW